VRRVVRASKSKIAHVIHIRHRDEVEAPITDWLQDAHELSGAGLEGWRGAPHRSRIAAEEEESEGEETCPAAAGSNVVDARRSADERVRLSFRATEVEQRDAMGTPERARRACSRGWHGYANWKRMDI
jgi:hypothetical protein